MLKIIPEPKKTTIKKGSFLFGHNLKFFADKKHSKTIKRLNAFLKDTYKFNLEIIEYASENNVIVIAENFIKPESCRLRKPESYILYIDSEIVIKGADPAGLFYGAMSLLQILENSLTIPKLNIKDSPAMKMRAEHWDLKGLMPTFSCLKKRLLDLSKYKINTILAEYEDKFEFEKHPLIVSPIALSRKQLKELIKTAENNFIDIIPLIQSLGHAEYVLKHKEYSHVAESSNDCQQYCASKQTTLELFKDFLDELLPLHSSRYVHVGGDETRQLGECPECAATVEKEGKMGLYFRHIKIICDYIVSIGKIPMIWDDMLCRNFRKDLLEQLPTETIIVPWLYDIKAEREPIFQGPDHTIPFSEKWIKKVYSNDNMDILNISHYYTLNRGEKEFFENIPESEIKLLKKYLICKGYPKYFNATPAIPLIKDAGLDFVGACAAQASTDGKFMPHSENKIANIKVWSKIIAKQKGIGLIATEWSRSGTLTPPNAPFETRWYAVLAMAEHSWTGGRTDDRQFDLKFNWRMFGLDDLRLTDALFFLRNPEDCRFAALTTILLKNIAKDIKRNVDIFDIFLNAADLIKLDSFFTKLWSREYKNWLYKIKSNTLHPTKRSELKDALKWLEHDIEKYRKNTIKVLSKTLPKQEMDEYVECVFTPIEDFAKSMKINLN